MNRRAAFLYQFLSQNGRIRLIGNMFHSMAAGHIICEFDNFLRMRHLGEIDQDFAYVAILQGSSLAVGLTRAYPHLFELRGSIFDVDTESAKVQIVMDNELFFEALQVQAFQPALFVDVGLSLLKGFWSSPADCTKARIVQLRDGCYAWMQCNEDYQIDLRNYERRIVESSRYKPWLQIDMDDSIRELAGHKLALVHIRYKRPGTNGGTLTEPSALFPTLAYLRDNGYLTIKIGTEPYPREFAAYSVLNYSESNIRSFDNDLRLFRSAAICIMNSSGVNFIPELMEIPMVNYGGWQFYNMPASSNCISVPSLLREKRSDRLLTLQQQFLSYKNRREFYLTATEHFPDYEFNERPPLGDEILAGVKEAVALGRGAVPWTEEQDRIVGLDPYNYRYARGRLSQYFLEKHRELLPGADPAPVVVALG
jgi:putative glycosyltransferase (TIGR04372 family)